MDMTPRLTAPTGLVAAVDPLAGTIRLTWQPVPPEPPAVTYDVERDAATVATGLADPEYTDGPLPPGTHVYRVRAVT